MSTELKGIDVSKHNPIKDGKKVKADGIDFVMIRLGFGTDSADNDDRELFHNLDQAKKGGLKIGLYFYSYALTMDNLKSEIKHAKRLLKEIHERGYEIEFPVAFDMEDADHYKEKHGMPKGETLVDFCYEWLKAIEDEGYYVSLYASKSWLNGRLKSDKLDRFDKWVAQWGDKCTYTGTYKMWQYASDGQVDGIDGRVDMNKAYSQFRSRTDASPAPKPEAKKQVVKPSEQAKPQTWTVRSGDSLYHIAHQFGLTLNELEKMNPQIKDFNKIYVGQKINIVKKSSPQYGIHTVKSGDTLWELAHDHHTTVARLMKLNPQIKRQDLIHVGDKIRYPK